MNEIGQDKQVVDLKLSRDSNRPDEVVHRQGLQRRPHQHVEQGDGQQLEDHLAIAFPLKDLHVHLSFLQEKPNEESAAQQRNGKDGRPVVQERVDAADSTRHEVTRHDAQQLIEIVDGLARIEKDQCEVEHRGVEHACGNGDVVTEHSLASRSQRIQAKEKPVAFSAGEGHENEIADVGRVVNPRPDGTEQVRRWSDGGVPEERFAG